MRTIINAVLCVLAFALVAPGPAKAQEAKSFAVLPFTINGPEKYKYLSRGIQDMLISRLSWTDHMEPVNKDKISAKADEPENLQAAVERAKSLAADYLVWGSVTMLEEQCSIDVNVAADSGKKWTESSRTPIGELIPELERISTRINNEIFNRGLKEEQEPAEQKQAERQVNPDLLYSQQAPGDEKVLNPQFRYEGGTSQEGRLRSPSLPFAAVNMICADLDSNGSNELIFIEGSNIVVYDYKDRRLVLVDKISPAPRIELLNLNLVDLNRDGIMEIAVSGLQDGEYPYSSILNFDKGKLKVIEKGLNFYLNVLYLPPTFSPTLVGQKRGSGYIFGGSICEVVRMSGGYELGKGVALPDKANIFNVTYLPMSLEDHKILVVSENDKIMVYTKSLELQYSTEEQFAGSSVGFKYKDIFPGMNKNVDAYEMRYYIPLRLVAVNLNDDKPYEVLVNKNISVAAQFFAGYRYFPQGEIHALFWDGIGLSLAWKTRRIKGTVVDYGINDVDNDGTMDLYICVVSHPGTLGLQDRKTFVVTYPLDLDKDVRPAY